MWRTATFAIAVLLWTGASASGPGLQAAVREQWVNSQLPAVFAHLETAAVRNYGHFAFQYHLDLGTVYLNFSDVTVTALAVNTTLSAVQFGPLNTLAITLKDVAVNASLGYWAKYELVEYQGQAEIVVPGVNVTVNVTVAAESEAPQVTINGLLFSAEPIKLTTSLISVTNDLVQHEINSELASLSGTALSLARQHLPALNAALAKLPHVLSLPLGLYADLGLAENVTATEDGVLAVGVNGTIFTAGEWSVGAVDPPVPLPTDFALPEGIAVSVSDYTVNTALSAYFSSMNVFIDSLPPSVPISLTTTTLAVLFPGLKAVYGPDVPLALRVSPGPQLPQYFTNGLLNFNGQFVVSIYAKQDNLWAPGLTLSVVVSLTADATLHNNAVSGAVKSLAISEITVVSSNVGTVNVYLLSVLLTDAIRMYLPEVNVLLQNHVSHSQNIAIPSSLPFTLSADDLAIYDGYLVLAVSPELPTSSLHPY